MSNISRIKKVSHKFRVIFSVLVILIPIADVLFWVMFNDLPRGDDIRLTAMDSNFDLQTRILLFAAGLVSTGVAIYGVLTLARLFRLYEKGIVFSADNVRYYRNLGFCIIGWVITSFLAEPLSSLIISRNNPVGEHYITVGFDHFDLFSLVIGAIVVLISWVMDEGRKLEDQQVYTI